MAKAKALIAPILCMLLLVCDTFLAPPYSSDYVFFWSNHYCLILAAIIPLILAKGTDLGIAFAVLAVMVHHLLDAYRFELAAFQMNDKIFVASVLLFLLAYLVLNRHRLPSGKAWLLLGVIPLKLLTENSRAAIGDKYVMNIGNAASFFILAAYTLMAIDKKYRSFAILLLAGTFINLEDNTIGEPGPLHPGEIVFFMIVAVDVVLWEISKRIRRPAGRPRYYMAMVVADVALLLSLYLPVWN